MSRAQEQIDCLGAMSAALLLGDTACTLSDDKITFACDADRFAKIVTQAMFDAMCVLPYQDLMTITLDLQRRTLLGKGSALSQRSAEKVAERT